MLSLNRQVKQQQYGALQSFIQGKFALFIENPGRKKLVNKNPRVTL